MMKYAGVLFDLDGTLFDHDHAEVSALDEIHASRPEIARVYTPDTLLKKWRGSVESHYNRFASGEITFQEQRILRVRETWAPINAGMTDRQCLEFFEEFLSHYRKFWRAFDDSLKCIQALEPKFKLGIITNGEGAHQRRKIEFCKLTKHFATVIASSEAGVSKPSAKIFELGAQALGVAKGECVYVGDRLDIDAIAARDAGMKGVWINRRGLLSIHTPPEILEIKDLNELVTFLLKTQIS